MRTKTLLVAAAALSAGLLASSAQVYSVNTVGYINLTLTPGYNLICNQLTNGNNNINVALTNGVTDGMQIQALVGGAFDEADQYYDGFGWIQADGVTPSTRIFTPGVGYLVLNPTTSSATVTLLGDVPQGTSTTTIAPGYGFYGSVVPVVSGLSTNGFPSGAAADGMQYSTFSGSPTPQYSEAVQYYNGFGWIAPDGVTSVDPAPAVGQGFLINNPSAAAPWVRNFTVN